jgi:hypothetical protein
MVHGLPSVITLNNASEAKYAFKIVSCAGYKPIPFTLFSNVRTGSAYNVKLMAEGPFLVRISLFFKEIVSLYDLEGITKLFIALSLAVFGAIFGRIMVACEAETGLSVDTKIVDEYFGLLKSSGFAQEEITFMQAMDKLGVDFAVADRIRQVLYVSLADENLPMSQYNVVKFLACRFVNDINFDSHVLEAIIAAIFFSLAKVRLSATVCGICIFPTDKGFEFVAADKLIIQNYGVFVDTTGCGEKIIQSACVSRGAQSQKEFDIGGNRTANMHTEINAYGCPLQCFFGDEQSAS